MAQQILAFFVKENREVLEQLVLDELIFGHSTCTITDGKIVRTPPWEEE